MIPFYINFKNKQYKTAPCLRVKEKHVKIVKKAKGMAHT